MPKYSVKIKSTKYEWYEVEAYDANHADEIAQSEGTFIRAHESEHTETVYVKELK